MRNLNATVREINHLIYELVKAPTHRVNFLQEEIRKLIKKENENVKKAA